MTNKYNQSPTPDDWDEDDELPQEKTSTASYENLSKALGHTSYKELEDKLNDVEAQLNEAQAKLEESKNQQLRSNAELDNVRKRAEKDINNAHKYSLERLLNDLLPIVDSLERGLSIDIGDNEFAKRMHEGLDMTYNLFLGTLKKFAITQVNPLGEAFNPTLHQAISTQEDPGVAPGTVIQVLQKGYLLHDRLIRPALVIVAK